MGLAVGTVDYGDEIDNAENDVSESGAQRAEDLYS